jgi:hypothetical protein
MRMRRHRWLIGLAAALVALGCGPRRPSGEPGDVREPVLFDALDTDRDGRLDRGEFDRLWEDAGTSQREYERLDTNRDGRISRDEFGAARLVILRW